ncbi:MAG TPA: cysteine--tRNA ligase [Gammaproteobacteria bacterium]|nr:cysteine--tRNA ligase [Gammaproteobacteria bacterium]
MQNLKIYNSFTQEKEAFKPATAGKVKMYVCGMTVYDFCHLGHLRMLTAFDVIVRYLRFIGFDVTYVRNITDVDDKIIKRANENHEDFHALAERFIQAMWDDLKALDLVLPDHEPRATEYIPQMIKLIEKLIQKKHAYVAVNGDVFFDVRSFKPYGCLSHRNIDDLESGARVEINDVKKDPLDFVLWKSVKAGEPSWSSPWGEGRPGWHIECSAMSLNLLGDHFDIHGGGKDLIFPHHENEIAQSEAATDKKFVSIWMHNGYVQVNQEKMSKSLGNFLTIRDLLKEYQPEAIRYFIIASHYRSPLQFNETAIPQARQALERFYIALRGLSKASSIVDSAYEKQFIEAMNDDFNTPVALSVLFDLAHEIQRLRNVDEQAAASHGALLQRLGCVLGILQMDPEVFLKSNNDIDAAHVEELIALRNKARAEKNWAEADRIRNELSVLGVTIEDTAKGTTWRVG